MSAEALYSAFRRSAQAHTGRTESRAERLVVKTQSDKREEKSCSASVFYSYSRLPVGVVSSFTVVEWFTFLRRAV